MLVGTVATHHHLATAIDTASLVLNGLLLFLIVHHSRFQIKEFKRVFMLTCVGDLMLSVVVLFGQSYLLFDEGYMLLVSNGYFSGQSALLDHAAMAAFCATLHINIVFVVAQYVWRYSLLCGPMSFIRMTKNSVICPVAWCFIQVLTATWCWTLDQDELRDEGNRILLNNGWKFDNRTAPYPSVVPGTALKTVVHHTFYLSASIIGYVIIVACQYGVAKFLRQLGMPSHHRTHRANNEVKLALVALALTPLSSLIPTAIMIASNALQIPLGHTISAYLSLGMTVITLANPLVTVYFVRPYREGLLQLLSFQKTAAVTPNQSTVGGSFFDLATRYASPSVAVISASSASG